MKVLFKEISINGFGKLEDKNLILNPGLNVIYGENEAGKSTFCEFIKASLFGFQKAQSKKINIDFEKKSKFTPWIAKSFSGSISISRAGEDYFLYNNFAQDQFELTKSSGEVQTIIDHREIGEFFLGLKQEIYEKMTNLHTSLLMVNNDFADLESYLYENVFDLEDLDKLRIFSKDLEKELEEIGSDKAFTKPYASTVKELDYLKSLVQNKTRLVEKQNKLMTDLKLVSDKLEDFDNKLVSLNKSKDRLIFDKDINRRTSSTIKTKDSENKFLSLIPSLIFIIVLVIALFLKTSLEILLAFSVTFVLVNLILKLLKIRNIEEEDKDSTEPIDVDTIRKLDKSSYDLDCINTEINSTLEDIKGLNTEKFTINKELLDTCDELDKIETLELNISDLEAKLAKLDQDKSVNMLIINSIDKYTHSIDQDLKKELTDTLEYFVNFLTEERYNRLIIGEKLDIKVFDKEVGKFVPIDELSTGSQELVYLALNLAINLSRTDYEIPIILDESTSFLDKKRKNRFFELLYKLSADRQILFFTNNKDDYEELSRISAGLVKF